MAKEIIIKNIVELLPLASRPPGAKSMDDWQPFPGNALGELVEKANKRCLNMILNEWKWPPEDIRDFAIYLVVVNHDLSTAADLERSRFRKILFLLMDIDDVQGYEAMISQLTRKIAGAAEAGSLRLLHHLGQVSRQAGVKSRYSLFQGLRIRPSRPQVLPDEEAFYAWLEDWCTYHYVGANSLRDQPGGAPEWRISLESLGVDIALKQDFRREIPRIAGEVRDNALLNDLTVEETQGLALQAGVQEYALLQVRHDVREQFGIPAISTDFLRAPVEELSTSRTLPAKQPLELLAVEVTQPWNQLKPEVRRKLSILGIHRKNRNAVVIDDPAIRKHLRSAGGEVQMKEFSTDLPLRSEFEGFDLLER